MWAGLLKEGHSAVFDVGIDGDFHVHKLTFAIV